MEKKLRKKFVSITMSVVATMLFIIMLGLNIVNYSSIYNKANIVINMMQTNDGILPNEFNAAMEKYGESAYAIRYFTVLFEDGAAVVDISNFRSITANDAISLAMNLSNDSGIIGDYKYQAIDIGGNTMIVFVDCSTEILMFKSTLIASICVATLSLLGVLILTVIFSKRAAKPFVDNNESQKTFITDISHELKTPLAIIKANTEVLEMMHGESDFSKDVHKQIEGLNNLILYLIKLSRMEESEEMEKSKIDLSKLLVESCDNIVVLSPHPIKREIKDDVTISGDSKLIEILISILLENAVKYGTGKIDVHLDNKMLKISNPCEGLKVASYDEWFERFYKADQSRNSNGSFGIGLSMAKRIAEKHNFKISALSEDGENITFKINL